MKLRLDADYVWARKIAKCFIDNNVCVGVSDHEAMLIGIDLHNLFVVHDGSSHNVYRCITIDLDVAKFDPFVAMREFVVVSTCDGEYKDCSIWKIISEYEVTIHVEDSYGNLAHYTEVDIDPCWCITLDGVEVME